MVRHVASLGLVTVSVCFTCVLFADNTAKGQAVATGKPAQGTLRIKDKTYQLEHAVAYQTKVFDQDAIEVILSSKPIAVDELRAALVKGQGKPDGFFLFQPHVVVTFEKSGKIRYSNCWADNTSLSVSGDPKLKGELAVKNGRAVGKATMETGEAPDLKSFAIRFDLPLLVIPIPKPEPKTAKTEKPKHKKKTKAAQPPSDDEPADTDGPLHVRDLPLPKDASDVEYKQLVEQITFKSPADVKTLAAYLSQKLKAQGWEDPDSGDLITPQSAILKREKGKASLTIFVKRASQGSAVNIMSEGLSWKERKPADGSDP
jgi:hypothetical protein